MRKFVGFTSLLLAAVMLTLMASCGASGGSAEVKLTPAPNLESTTDIKTIVAAKGDYSNVAEGEGEVFSTLSSALFFERNGVLKEVLVKNGDIVKKGDVIAVLEPLSLGDGGEDDLLFRLTQIDYELARKNTTDKNQLRLLEINYTLAEQRYLDGKGAQVSDAVVAPFDGVISNLSTRIFVGRDVPTSIQICKIYNPDSLLFQLPIKTRVISPPTTNGPPNMDVINFFNEGPVYGEARMGNACTLFSPTLGDFSASVVSSCYDLPITLSNITVTIKPDDPEKKLKPGDKLTVRLNAYAKNDIIALPEYCIITDSKGLSSVKILVDNHVYQRKVTLGVSFGYTDGQKFYEILYGVNEGDVIVRNS